MKATNPKKVIYNEKPGYLWDVRKQKNGTLIFLGHVFCPGKKNEQRAVKTFIKKRWFA